MDETTDEPLIEYRAAQPEGKNRHGRFTAEYQVVAARHDAERRNWEVRWRDGVFLLTDSAGTVRETFYDGRVVSCGCPEYFERDIGTCMHGEILAVHRVELASEVRASKALSNVVGLKGVGPQIVPGQGLAGSGGVRLWRREDSVIPKPTKKTDDLAGFRRLPGVDEFLARPDTTLAFDETEYGDVNVLPGVTLRSYQEESVRKMLRGKRSVLTLRMGLGKTVCALSCIRLLGRPRTLVVCPASLKLQWKAEIERFLGVTPEVVMGSRDLAGAGGSGRPVVINYELLVRNPGFMAGWDVAVMDEIQKVRNKATQVWRAMAGLQTEYMFALSGTVIENRVEDLLSVIEILNPEELRPEWRFCADYCNVTSIKVRGFRPDRIAALRRRLDRYIVNPDVSKLTFPVPEKREHHVVTGWGSADQKAAHDEPFAAAKLLLAAGQNRALTFAEQVALNGMLTKARLASNDLRLSAGKGPRGEKIAAIRSTLESLLAAGRKVVVYSDWVKMLNLVSEELKDMGVAHGSFTGEISLKARNASFERFVTDPGVRVLLATDTGGVGIDGLQFVCDAVVHTEMAWNPAKVDQRNGRVARALNPRPAVDVYYFRTGDGVEAMMLAGAARKSSLRHEFLS